MNNTIIFQGVRDSVSSTGNVEYFTFTISSERNLDKELIKELVDSHGCGGQSCSWEYEMSQGQHLYNGKSTRYSD